MKTKIWIALLAVLLVICAGLSVWLLWPSQADTVEVWFEGKLMATYNLNEDTSFSVTTEKTTNTIEIKDGKIAVTSANCPDQYCVKRGWCSGGAQIVCLPHGLVLKFQKTDTIDSISG